MSAPMLTQEQRERLESLANTDWADAADLLSFGAQATFGDLRALLSAMDDAVKERDEAQGWADWRASILRTLLRQTSNGYVRGECGNADCLHIWCRVIRDARIATAPAAEAASEKGAQG